MRQAISKPNSSSVWEKAADAVSETAGMSKDEFGELIRGFWKGLGRTSDPDQQTRQVWYVALRDLTATQFGNAILRFLTQQSSEYPSIQAIRELSGVQEASEVSAVAAWDEAVDAIRIFGGYARPQFRDPKVAMVIQHLGGWVKFCDTPSEEFHQWTRQHFMKTYKALRNTTPEPVRLLSLVDTSNAQNGMTDAADRIRVAIEHRQEQQRLGHRGDE